MKYTLIFDKTHLHFDTLTNCMKTIHNMLNGSELRWDDFFTQHKVSIHDIHTNKLLWSAKLTNHKY